MEETLGERVRRLRKDKDWTQVALAYNADRAPSVVSQVETGKREPELSTIKALAEALDVDWRYLLLGDQLPKAPSRPSPAAPEEVPIEERLLSYTRSQKLQVERMRERWEEATEQNTFSYEAWNEAAEITVEIEQAFADAVPVAIYKAGEKKWLPHEERKAVDELLGNISVLNQTIQRAFRAYQSRFGEKGAPANVKDLAAIREQREQRAAAKRRANARDHRAG